MESFPIPFYFNRFEMLHIPIHKDYAALLSNAKNIAVVGLSPKEGRPSNDVARYLLGAGYTIFPVNPGQESILGMQCYPNLHSVPAPIDIVNIFRRSSEVMPVVEAAVAIGATTVWMQEGIVNVEAARFAEEHGLQVVMDRCIKIDHMNLAPAAR